MPLCIVEFPSCIFFFVLRAVQPPDRLASAAISVPAACRSRVTLRRSPDRLPSIVRLAARAQYISVPGQNARATLVLAMLKPHSPRIEADKHLPVHGIAPCCELRQFWLGLSGPSARPFDGSTLKKRCGQGKAGLTDF